MIEFPSIVLAAYHERANWARHYDSIRVGITALVVTLSGATVTAVWTLKNDNAAQIAVCCAMIVAGLLLSGLSVLYNAEYRSARIAERKMQGLAIDFLTDVKGKDSYCQITIWKKQAQAHYEALGISYPEKIENLGCKKTNGDWEKWPTQYQPTSIYWNYQTIKKAVGSGWIFLNIVLTVLVPLALLFFKP